MTGRTATHLAIVSANLRLTALSGDIEDEWGTLATRRRVSVRAALAKTCPAKASFHPSRLTGRGIDQLDG